MRLRKTVLAISTAAMSLGFMLAPGTFAQNKKDAMVKADMKKDEMKK